MGRNKPKKTVRGVRSKSRKTAAKTPTGTIHDFIGILAGKTKKVATIEEINEAAARGWAGEVKMATTPSRTTRHSPKN
jgi:hypothetical protein